MCSNCCLPSVTHKFAYQPHTDRQQLGQVLNHAVQAALEAVRRYEASTGRTLTLPLPQPGVSNEGYLSNLGAGGAGGGGGPSLASASASATAAAAALSQHVQSAMRAVSAISGPGGGGGGGGPGGEGRGTHGGVCVRVEAPSHAISGLGSERHSSSMSQSQSIYDGSQVRYLEIYNICG